MLRGNSTWMLKVRANIYAHPNTDMIPMLERIAIGPFLSASLVSSVRCAAASYPYREYWLTRTAIMAAYALLDTPVASDAVSNEVNTYEAGCLVMDTRGSMITITSPPITCKFILLLVAHLSNH